MMRFAGLLAMLLVAACGGDDDNTGTSGPGSGAAGAGAAGGAGGAGGELGGGGAGGVLDVQMAGDITEYALAFDVVSGAATSEVSFDVTQEGNCIAIADELAPSAVTMNGSDAGGAVSDGVLTACGPQTVPVGQTLSLITEQVVPEQTFLNGLDVGFSRRNNLAGGDFSYLLSWVGGCDHFGPVR